MTRASPVNTVSEVVADRQGRSGELLHCLCQLLALLNRSELGRARQLCPGISDVNFLSDLDRVIDLDAEIADGALDLGVAEQELNGSKVPGSSVDHGRLGPPERVRAEFQRVEADAGDPLADEARILSCRQSTSRATTSGEQELAGLPVRYAQVVVEGLARLFRQLKPDGAASFFLPDRSAVESVAIRGDVIDANSHDVTAPICCRSQG